MHLQRSGRRLLERCDKLLHSIAAFTGAEQDTATDQQPSPVSVLDSLSYLGEEVSPSPSPLAKRSIDFKGSVTKPTPRPSLRPAVANLARAPVYFAFFNRLRLFLL